MIYGAEYTTWATEPESIEVEGPELPGCPVMIASGLYQVDEEWPDMAIRMLRDHLTDETRTCCDEHGFALPFELTSPVFMPRLEPIQQVVRPTAPESREVA